MSFDPRKYSSTPNTNLNEDITFNIVHISNISKSSVNQLDDWKEYLDPNTISVDKLANSHKKGPRVIREVATDDSAAAISTSDKYKLVLCDQLQNYSFAYELDYPLPFLRNSTETKVSPLPIRLGGRLVVKKGTLVSNGVLLLTPVNCHYLGIDERDRDLVDKLNNGIVKKYIDLLEQSLRD